MEGLQGIAPETRRILQRLQEAAPESACEGKCRSIDIIPFEEHRPRCDAVLVEKERRLRQAGVGKRAMHTLLYDLRETEALRQTRAYLRGSYKAGSALILAGNTGTGKTVAASYVIGEVGGLSIYSADLQKAFLSDRINDFRATNFLVIDDLGTEYRKDFFDSNLDALIYHRHKLMMATIITTNLSDDEFKEEYRGRIISRIREWGCFVNIVSEDMRGKNGKEY